jgi:hypothetical protein
MNDQKPDHDYILEIRRDIDHISTTIEELKSFNSEIDERLAKLEVSLCVFQEKFKEVDSSSIKFGGGSGAIMGAISVFIFEFIQKGGL